MKWFFSLFIVMLVFPFIGICQGLLETEKIRNRLFDRIGSDDKEKARPQFLEGTLGRVTDSESVWIRIDSRRNFRKWTYKLSKESLNLPRQEVRVWLQYVSPKLSVNHGKEYNEWFKKKVAFEVGKTFYNQHVRAEYNYSEVTYRLKGMIWSGKSNLNLWLVQNGWSFYMLPENPIEEQEDFLSAEKQAQKDQVGLWSVELKD